MAAPDHTSWGLPGPINNEARTPAGAQPPGYIYGYLSAQSGGAAWLLDPSADLSSAEPYRVAEAVIEQAAAEAMAAGMRGVMARSSLGLAVRGTAANWDALHGLKTTTQYSLVLGADGVASVRPHADVTDDRGRKQQVEPRVGEPVEKKNAISAVGFDMVRTLLALTVPLPDPPAIGKGVHHLTVPDDITFLTGASRAHDAGHLGVGITVAVVDTGCYAHPYFRKHDYHVESAIAVVPDNGPGDPIGHGTAVCANLLAVAPKARVVPYRATDDFGGMVALLAAFMKAKADKPDVITCSWGGESVGPLPAAPRGMDRAMVLEIRDAVEQGIVVVFAAGNGAHSIEAQVPGVISAGAAYVTHDVEVFASDVGSAYESVWQPGLNVPTVCGLVGMRPRGQYILLPVAPACHIDIEESKPEVRDGQSYPGDGTTADDGWALLSGTSAAAPQVAGAAAVLLGAKPGLKGHPDKVAALLSDTALDIKAGRCHPNFAYTAGKPTGDTDIPTGHGLINVSAAVEAALGHPL